MRLFSKASAFGLFKHKQLLDTLQECTPWYCNSLQPDHVAEDEGDGDIEMDLDEENCWE